MGNDKFAQSEAALRRAQDEAQRQAYAEAVNRRLQSTRNDELDPIGMIKMQWNDYMGMRPIEDRGKAAFKGSSETDARLKMVDALMKQAKYKKAEMPTYSPNGNGQ